MRWDRAQRLMQGVFVSCLTLMLSCGMTPSVRAGEETGTWLVVPAPVYAPETEMSLTLTAMWHARRPGAMHPQAVLASASYSQRDQARLRLMPELSFQGDRWRIDGELSYRDWPDYYYGIGHDTDEDDEESYTAQDVNFVFSVRRRILTRGYLGLRGRFADYGVHDPQADGSLAQADVPGSEGGQVFGLGLVGVWDDREDRFLPHRGRYLELSGMVFHGALSDFDFQFLRADLRQYFNAPGPGSWAAQQYVNVVFGDVPFQDLSLLGDIRDVSLMRGYYTGRYRDRYLAMTQLEWRSPRYGRISGTLFGGLGMIGEAFFDGNAYSLYPSYGIGVRYRATDRERVNLRMDVAFGMETYGVYFGMLEAF